MRKLMMIFLIALAFLAGALMGDWLGFGPKPVDAGFGCLGAPNVNYSRSGSNDPMDPTEHCVYYYTLGGLGSRKAIGASVKGDGKTLVVIVGSTY